ncbi:MAG: sulfatase-like hydrolase/transferase [bacterium]|nr:sulfatase-like hydrolase/transferase [bacterium]
MAKQSEGRYNLLFLMTDQQRFDALSRAGNSILDTPNLDRLANQGAYFENAYTCCPVCVPARMAMLTGCSIETTGVRMNAEAKDENVTADSPIQALRTYDEVLMRNGYVGEYYGKWHSPAIRAYAYENRPIGIAGTRSHPELGLGLAGIYRAYLDEHSPERPAREGELVEVGTHRPYRPDPIDVRYGVPESEWVNIAQSGEYGCLDVPREHTRNAFDADRTMDALRRRKDETFTIHCSFGPPHPPMVTTEYYHSQFDPQKMLLPENYGDPMENSPYRAPWLGMEHYRNPDTVGYMIANYYAMVKEIDDQVGRILNTLDDLGLTDRTLVIFTSDHGEMLGDHGMHSKFIFYEASAHIPLMMRLPGIIPAGSVVSAPVSQHHFFATILDYLEVQDPGSSNGQSLRGLVDGNGWDGPDFAVSEWARPNVPNFMVRTNRWKFMFARDAESQAVDALYDLENDPLEMNNLIGNNPDRSEHRKQAEEMKERLVSWLASVHSPHTEGVKARPV